MPVPELLAPAGNLEKLKTAILYGADAVYMGGKDYSLRAHAANFDKEQLAQAVRYAHDHKVKAYVTVNILAHNRDLDELPDYLLFLKKTGVDGLIIADPGIFSLARQTVAGLAVHLSTQANVTNYRAARFWQEQGVKRLNVARELSLAEITTLREKTGLELEVFVHGALCISYSGRCMLSYYLTGRNANQGDCAHPCRYSYSLFEEKRPGQSFPVEENDRGTYIFNSKDLCLLPYLPQLIKSGVDSLKIEGRMKSVYYVGAVVRIYRAALDYIRENPATESLPAAFIDELAKIGSRGYTDNFFYGPPGPPDMLYDRPRIEPTHVPVGIIRRGGNRPVIEIRSPLVPPASIEYLEPGREVSVYTVKAIYNEKGESLVKANPGNIVSLETTPLPVNWREHGLLRMQVKKAMDRTFI